MPAQMGPQIHQVADEGIFTPFKKSFLLSHLLPGVICFLMVVKYAYLKKKRERKTKRGTLLNLLTSFLG